MKQLMLQKQLENQSNHGDYYDLNTPLSRNHYQFDDDFPIKVQDHQSEEEKVLFNSQQQMAKELNYVPYYNIDQALHFENHDEEENQIREKRITWQDVTKNVLETPRRGLSPFIYKKQSSILTNKIVLKNSNQNNGNMNGSFMSKQCKTNFQIQARKKTNHQRQTFYKLEFIQKYFKDMEKSQLSSSYTNFTLTPITKEKQNFFSEELKTNQQFGVIHKIAGFQRRRSVDKDFVYFTSDAQQNLTMKKQFWQQMREYAELPQPKSIIQASQFSVDSMRKKSLLIKKTVLQRKNYQNRSTNSNSIISLKSQQLKIKEVKIIDAIKVRPKSCCCNDCGGESQRMKKLITLPFKTITQHVHEANKLGINTGLKCVAFIGKVRKSRYYDSNFQFNFQNLQHSNSQDSVGNESTVPLDQESPLLDFQSERVNKNTLSIQASPANDSKYNTINQNSRKQSYVGKTKEDQQSIASPLLKIQLVVPTQDNNDKGSVENNMEGSIQLNQLIRQPTDLTEDSEYLDGESNQDEVNQHDDISNNKMSKRISDTSQSQKDQYKPILDRQQSVKKMMLIHRQQSRAGQITKLVINKDNSTISEKQTPKTPIPMQFKHSLQQQQNNHSQSQNSINRQGSYHMEESSQTERSHIPSKNNITLDARNTNTSQDEKISQNQKQNLVNIKLKPIVDKEYKDTQSINHSDHPTKRNKSDYSTSKEEYYPNQNHISSNQLQQMIYLPLRSLSKITKHHDNSYQNNSKKSIKFMTITSKNKSNHNTEDAKSMESSQTQRLNTTAESAKDAKLIQFNRRIHTQEEEKLISLSSRSDYKLLQLHKDHLKQLTYTPKIATQKDFLQRFAISSKNQKQLSKKMQNIQLKLLNESNTINHSINNEKSPLLQPIQVKDGYKPLLQQNKLSDKATKKDDKLKLNTSKEIVSIKQKLQNVEIKQQQTTKPRILIKSEDQYQQISSPNIK